MKAIKRMKEIQKIQRLFHQNNSDPARTRTWNPLIRKSDALSIGPQGLFLRQISVKAKRQFSCRCTGGLIAPKKIF